MHRRLRQIARRAAAELAIVQMKLAAGVLGVAGFLALLVGTAIAVGALSERIALPAAALAFVAFLSFIAGLLAVMLALVAAVNRGEAKVEQVVRAGELRDRRISDARADAGPGWLSTPPGDSGDVSLAGPRGALTAVSGRESAGGSGRSGFRRRS